MPIYNYIKSLVFLLIVFNLRAVKREIKVSGHPTEVKLLHIYNGRREANDFTSTLIFRQSQDSNKNHYKIDELVCYLS